MKKTLHVLLFSLFAVAGVAQQKATLIEQEGPKSVQKRTVEEQVKIDRSAQFPSNHSNREIVFHETFENGFIGSTPFGAWTFSHNLTGVPSAQGTMWSIGDPDYVNTYGNGTVGSDALVSASPDNYALWDGAQYAEDFPNSLTANGFYSGYLNAPVLDFSELPTVLVDFQQVFRYCCFPGSPISLDVSVDGGATWTSFNAIGDAIEGSNIQSVNPLNTTIDISCVAANQSNVQLRFAYNSAEEAGYTHYFWAVDEVVIYTNDYENDIFIKELVNGNILSDWEHRVTPMEQKRGEDDGGVIVGVLAGNKGSMEQSNVTVTFTLTTPSGVDTTFTTDPFHLYSATNDTICPHNDATWFFWETGYVPTEVGLYGFSATINGAEELEETQADNTITETLVFNDIAEYGHDGDSASHFQWQVGSRFVSGTTGPREPSGFGSHYTFINNGSSAHGITVRFGSNTEVGVEFKAALIAQNGANLDDSETVASGNYETRTGWNTSEPLYFAFNGSFPVGGVYPAQPYSPLETFDSGTNYVAAIWRSTPGVGQLSVRAQETNDVDLSSVAWEKGGDQDFHWFHFQEFNYGVRLILSGPYVNHIPVAIEEIEAPKTSFSVYPNPAVNETRISFNLAESSFIAYEVRDMQGRLMDTDNIGRFGIGANSFALDVSEYPAGNYIVGLVVDGKQFITQQMAVVR